MPYLNLNLVADAGRGVLNVIEAGPVNGAQRRAIDRVRVILGDLQLQCSHPNTVYEEGDVLVCQDCRMVLQTA